MDIKALRKKTVALCMGVISVFHLGSHAVENDALPFLRSPYLYEYLHESKMMMNGKVVSENKTETTYDEKNRINGMVATMNGEKILEQIDYVYGDRKRTNTVHNYTNGQLTMSTKVSDTFADDIYRNILVSERETEIGGNKSITRVEYTYDGEGRIIGMREFLNGQLQMEQKEYVWTPNSCEYLEERLLPFPSTSKVKKQFQDEYYLQNVEEVHTTEMNGVKSEVKSQYEYDDNGNLASGKFYLNGVLTSEWKDYNWGEKKSSHKEVSYINGNPTMITEVSQHYK